MTKVVCLTVKCFYYISQYFIICLNRNVRFSCLLTLPTSRNLHVFVPCTGMKMQKKNQHFVQVVFQHGSVHYHFKHTNIKCSSITLILVYIQLSTDQGHIDSGLCVFQSVHFVHTSTPSICPQTLIVPVLSICKS